MKKVRVLLCVFAAFSGNALADVPVKPEIMETPSEAQKRKEATDHANQETNLEEAVDEALKALEKDSPQVHKDSLRVWKNFSSKSRPVHYTYRFWGRRIILWLKDEKKIAFQSEEQVGEVFEILRRKGLISKNAVVVLMVDAWAHLVYLEGAPSWEKRVENRNPQGGTAPNGSMDRASY